jgi:hypothetical protein
MFELKGLRVSKENVLRAEAVDGLMERLEDMIKYAERQVKEDAESNNARYEELKSKYPDASVEDLIEGCSWEYENWCEHAANVEVLKNLRHDFAKAFVK